MDRSHGMGVLHAFRSLLAHVPNRMSDGPGSVRPSCCIESMYAKHLVCKFVYLLQNLPLGQTEFEVSLVIGVHIPVGLY